MPLEYVFWSAVTFCAVTDALQKKLYNWVTYPLIIIGIIYNAMQGSVKASLLGFGIILLLGGTACYFRWLGGGDTKLVAAIGAWLGLAPVFNILLVACFIGTAWGLVLLARHGMLKGKLEAWKVSLGIWWTSGLWQWLKYIVSLERLPEDGSVPPTGIPYGTCIALASLVYVAIYSTVA